MGGGGGERIYEVFIRGQRTCYSGCGLWTEKILMRGGEGGRRGLYENM